MTSRAQPTFRAFASSLELPEGGKIETIVTLLGAERVTVRVPQGYSAQVKTEKQSVVFTDKDGKIAITLKATSDWPGVMPADDILRAKASAATPGAVQADVTNYPTGYSQARIIDSVKTISPSLSLKVRHGFVACPEGTLEVICAANGADFPDASVVYNGMMASLQVEQIKKEETTAPH